MGEAVGDPQLGDYAYQPQSQLVGVELGRLDDVRRAVESWVESPWKDASLALLGGDLLAAADLYHQTGALPEEAFVRLRAARDFAAYALALIVLTNVVTSAAVFILEKAPMGPRGAAA